MKKHTLAVVAATIFAAPNSHASGAAEFCDALANIAEMAAIDRDRGTPAASIQEFAARQRHISAETRALVISLIDGIYTDRRIKKMSPDQVRASAFVSCLRYRK
jgi:hypothetical protein